MDASKKRREATRRWTALVFLMTMVGFVVSGNAFADSTTGFTFNLSNGATLHDVYIWTTDGAGNNLVDLNALVTGGTTVVGDDLSPAGFNVATGQSTVNLAPLCPVPANCAAPQDWVMMGLTTINNQDHVVLGTNADLTGLNLLAVTGNNFSPFTEQSLVGWLQTGLIAPAGGSLELVAEDLAKNGYMQTLGQTSQLFYFSTGTALGASVSSDTFGTSGPAGGGGQTTVPEPSSLALLSGGLTGLGAMLKRRYRLK